ncbi:MAG: membrane protein insertion efficiency factor YidD [Candidatus Ratteibacteria bacterium]|jgi:putative membrane protein insertion efficiency factor
MIARILLLLIRFYRITLSPLLGSRCRFYPSCSSYCSEALTRFPLKEALKLSFIRIARCNPFFTGGIDPLPERNRQ